jgi:predicted Ser/Thr protein kinase
MSREKLNYNSGEEFFIGRNKFVVEKFLGKGKSGYSYLVKEKGTFYVLKIMHYEPCSYYDFGRKNKVDLEVNAYEKLKKVGIRIPPLLEFDEKEDYLLKEYIPGLTATEVIGNYEVTDDLINQLFDMFSKVKNAGINIDYFPSNFVVSDSKLYYIDYEFNIYMEEWDLLNWGIYYWANFDGMAKFLETNDASYINVDLKKGIPIKGPFERKTRNWILKFHKI